MPNLSIMIKPASSLCNMRCKYCFYHSLAEQRESFSFEKMTNDTVENLIRKAIFFADGKSIYFSFQGGEPLIAGQKYFENFVAEVNKKNLNNTKIYYALQTNGTLITDEWAKFFAKHKFLIGLSLDGDRSANRYRIDNNSDYTFPKVMQTVDILRNHNVEFNILIVTTAYTAEHIDDIYKWFTLENGFKYLQFIPCLRELGKSDEGEMYMSVAQYANFLIRLFNLYVSDYLRGEYVSIRHFDNYVDLYFGRRPEQCGVAGHCSHQFVIEGNGNVYPCDFYCVDKYLLGNINTSNFSRLAHCNTAINFIKDSFALSDKCLQCKYYSLCRGGGCKRNREYDYCEAYKLFFSSCLPLFNAFKKS